MLASAPGKILVCGEYAVLDGAEALVMAVDRRAVARLAPGAAHTESPFLAAAARHIARECGDDSDAARAARQIAVDTSALADGGRKLGLGSSAAATVAAIARALAEPASTDLDRERVHRLAHAAHAEAQAARGAAGSGADIAASVHGGLIAVRRVDAGPLAVRRLTPPPAPQLVAVWTGEPADTVSRVAQVEAGRARAGWSDAIRAIADAAAAFIAAGERGDPAACVAAVDAGREALARLAGVTGAKLVSPRLDAIADLARRAGGAAKPTGAGGGDIALAAFATTDLAWQFRGELAASGLGTALELALAVDGVRIDAG